MPSPRHLSMLVAVGAVAVAVGVLRGSGRATASDHDDPPTLAADRAQDLGDLYVWPAPDDTLAVALTIAPGLLPGEATPYDAGVLYGIHFDTDPDDPSAERTLWVQFGVDPRTREVGVRVRGLPGDQTLIGPVEEVIEGAGGTRLWAGLRDDPFFFDEDGFAQSLADQTLQLDPGADFHAGTNAIAVVLQLPAGRLGASTMRVWATAGRIR